MEKVRPWCGQPWDRGRLKNRTEQNSAILTEGRALAELVGVESSQAVRVARWTAQRARSVASRSRLSTDQRVLDTHKTQMPVVAEPSLARL